MARGDNIATTVPSVGDSETAASTDLVTIVNDLIAIAETKVTPSEVDMDATLDFNSQGAENLDYLEFVSRVGDPTPTETVYTKSGELYFQDSSSNAVQITTGGSLNVAATGSITGAGYGSGGVAVNWNSAGTNYQFKDGAGGDDYAALTASDLQLRDADGDTLTLSPGVMSADMTLTFPTALPASASFLYMGVSGVISYGNSNTPYAGFLHDEVTVTANLGAATEINGSAAFSRTNATQGDWYNATATGTQGIGVPLEVATDDIITEIKVLIETNNNPDTVTLDLRRIASGGSDSSIATTTTTSTGQVTWNVADTTVAVDYVYYLRISWTGTSGTQVGIAGVWYTYKR